MATTSTKRIVTERKQFGNLTLEVSDTTDGLFVRLLAPHGSGDWQEAGGNYSYTKPVMLGNRWVLFTRYWEGSHDDILVETPMRLLPPENCENEE